MIRTPDPGQWTELFAAFDSLVELDTDARAEQLVAIGAANPDARRALEELLAADANPASNLERIDAIFGAAELAPERSANRDVLKLVGQTVAHFRIVEPLATGGMGVVYRAIDPHLGRRVALKFPLPGQHVDDRVRERFLREARAAGALDHPNICGIYEAGETETGQLFLAMPLYEGETLRARIARTGPLPISDALSIALQVARGLDAAHRAGIVHRDLKPANVMILPDGGLKILDFGVARVGDGTMTASHGTIGTVFYMAPEQIFAVPVDGRADLWALGVVLYEMLTGRRPFDGQHAIAVAHAIVESDPVRPSVLRPEISHELDALVLGLLIREPAKRRASAEAVVAELTAVQSPSSRKVRRRRPTFTAFARRKLAWVSAIALVVTGVGITASKLRARAGGESVEPRVVAVLPFENRNRGDDGDYLSVALADDIAMRLSRLRAVTVPGELSAPKYRGSSKPTLGLASDLGAGDVASVNARRAGDELVLLIDLFDVAQKRRVQTREYRGPVSTVLALQQNATDGIIAALDIDVTRGERAVLTRVPTARAEAYDFYLRGRAAEIGAASGDSTQRVESLQRAQAYYARARESDPDFAAPRASLATSHLALAPYDRTTVRRDQARIEAEAALRLQPGMPEAHEALASYWLLRGELPNSNSELERALVGRPNASDLYRLLGMNLRQLGRWEEALSAFERASRLDPRNRSVHRQAALTYSRLRRYDEAIAHWNRVISLDSVDWNAQMIRGQAYLRRGDADSLDAAMRRIPLGLDPGGMVTYSHYTAHRVMRRHAEALASLDSARFAISSDEVLYRPVALMRAETLERLGDVTRARLAYNAARALLEDSVAGHPREAKIRVALGLAYAGLHRRADAMREARNATEIFPVSGNSTGATAAMGGAVEIYARLGETDAALELIGLLLAMPAGREISIPLLHLDPTFDPLRSDPRFEALIGRFSRN
jgi:serine/threonine-protein kinase